ncbi:MAG: hypothetical protein H0Z39_11085 [Peptococcaceae bacterium]|nr:hypothetical protein [Peptococcaceae bacterium]
MNRERLVRKQTYITQRQNAAIKKIALQKKITEADVIRQAIDAYIKPLADEQNPILELKGIGRSGSKDGSKRHDYYLYGR